jgi:hypothetical protein
MAPNKPVVERKEEVSEDQEEVKEQQLLPCPRSPRTPAPESLRLKNRLINPYQRDIEATVGSYDPYSNTMINEKTTLINFSRGAERFRYSKGSEDLGPGCYSNQIESSKSIGSPFSSTTQRFKAVNASNQIAPGSYDVDMKINS